LLLFKKYGIRLLDYRPKDDWEWLAIGQHHGLPTRLLDWSSNPLVAAYFAAEGSPDTDCAVYAMRAPMVVDTARDRNPLARGTGVDVVTPDHVSNRIAAQAGMFTIHWQPEKPILRNGIDKFLLPRSERPAILLSLFGLGIHRGTLFPDLDGQSRFIEWLKFTGPESSRSPRNKKPRGLTPTSRI
jgi:hypothetical protein